MLHFEDCDISINGTGIIAESVSLNSDAPVASIPTLGRSSAFYSPVGFFQNNLQITYFLEPTNEPNFRIVSGFKNITTSVELNPVIIKFAGISGAFYLNDYSITTRENDAVSANATYIGFSPLSGALAERDGTVTYNSNSGSGIAHYYTSAIGLKRWRGGYLLNQWYLSKYIYNCNYNFRVNLIPVQTLGSAIPKSVCFLGGEESINVLHDQFIPLNYYGFESWSGLQLPTHPEGLIVDFYIRFAPVSERPLAPYGVADSFPLDCYIGLVSGLIKTEQISATTNDMVRVNSTIIRNF